MAFVNIKSKREADNLVLINELKTKLVSKQFMTTDFYNYFVRKNPAHNSMRLRDPANTMITTYDSLVSADSCHLRQDAHKEYTDYTMGGNDTLQEYFCKFEGLLWNRNSKHTAEQVIPTREAVRKLITGLNGKWEQYKVTLETVVEVEVARTRTRRYLFYYYILLLSTTTTLLSTTTSYYYYYYYYQLPTTE